MADLWKKAGPPTLDWSGGFVGCSLPQSGPRTPRTVSPPLTGLVLEIWPSSH